MISNVLIFSSVTAEGDTSELGLESRYLSSPGSSSFAGLGSSNLGLQKQQLLLQQLSPDHGA